MDLSQELFGGCISHVDGSKDAILSCLDTYDNEEVRLDIMNAEIGDVTQEDIEYASNFEV